MSDQLDALGLPATERRARLAEFEVIQAGISECLQGALDPFERREKSERLFHGQIKDFGDVAVVELDVERFAIESRALANFTADKRRGQKIHLQLDGAGAFTLGAAPLGAVEGKSAGRVAAQPRLGHLGEKLPDEIENSHIG